MHGQKIFFRSIVFNYYKAWLKVINIHKTLQEIYENKCPSYSFVKKWNSRFMCGQTTFEDDPKSGRPMISEEGKYHQKITKLIEQDRYISIKEIACILGFSNTKTKNIINGNLGLKKKMNKWVPHSLTQNQKDRRISFCNKFLEKYDNKNEKNIYNIITGDETWLRFWDPKVGNNAKIWQINGLDNFEARIKSIRDEKIMASVFFTKSGNICISILEENKTANAMWYRDYCLKSMLNEWKKSHKKCGFDKIQLHHDNAPIHKSSIVKNFITEKNIKLLEHPPYSPDLSPCDFWLFPVIKQRLRGAIYDTRDDVIHGFKKEVEKLTINDYNICFESWIKRCKLVVEKNGNYI